MKLRPRLYLLAAGALTPMVVFAIVAALLLQQREHRSVEREAIGRARAAMSAVDAHLRASISSLETLAASRNLESGAIGAFHAESQRALRAQPDWVNIGLATGAKIQLANAIYTYGKPEPFSTGDDESFEAVVRTARAGVGNVSPGNAVRSPTVRVRVPVAYGGEVRYVISAPLNLKRLADVLAAQHSPEDSMIALVDKNKRVIARIPAAPAGAPAPDGFREAIERSPEGWFEGLSPEGRSTYTSYVTSPLSGWQLGIVIPGSTVEAGARRTFAIMGAGILSALVLGSLLSWLIARRIPD